MKGLSILCACVCMEILVPATGIRTQVVGAHVSGCQQLEKLNACILCVGVCPCVFTSKHEDGLAGKEDKRLESQVEEWP